MYHIQIVGAGYLGSRIARYFRSQKQKVTAIARSASCLEAFERNEIRFVAADLTKPETLRDLPPANFVVYCPAPDTRSEQAYRDVYVEGLRHYLQALRTSRRPHFILHISSTGVWDHETGVVDVDCRPTPQTERGRILLEAEKILLDSEFPGAVYRLSGIYGPGRNRLEALRQGEWPEPGPDRWLNMIHVDDIVQTIRILFKKASNGGIYVGVDDRPVRASELYTWLCGKTGRSVRDRIFQKGTVQGRSLRNNALKSLGVSFRYPTFREGYAEILKQEEARFHA